MYGVLGEGEMFEDLPDLHSLLVEVRQGVNAKT